MNTKAALIKLSEILDSFTVHGQFLVELQHLLKKDLRVKW